MARPPDGAEPPRSRPSVRQQGAPPTAAAAVRISAGVAAQPSATRTQAASVHVTRLFPRPQPSPRPPRTLIAPAGRIVIKPLRPAPPTLSTVASNVFSQLAELVGSSPSSSPLRSRTRSALEHLASPGALTNAAQSLLDHLNLVGFRLQSSWHGLVHAADRHPAFAPFDLPDDNPAKAVLSYLSPALLTAILAFLVLIMSWSSRFGGWSGRFSPFGRPAASNDGRVSDEQYSYITSEDLRSHLGTTSGGGGRIRSKSRGAADDILVIKHRRVSYPIHFERGSIDDGELTVGILRIEAAKQLDVSDPRRIKLFYKGRHLKDDRALARDEGLSSAVESEILCVVGEAPVNGSHSPDGGEYPERAWSVGSDESDDDTDDMEAQDRLAPPTQSSSGGKKKRNRKGKKKGRKQSSSASASATGAADSDSHRPYSSFDSAAPPRSEYLPLPTGAAPRPSSAPPRPTTAPRGATTPQTPLQKLDALASNFHTSLVPDCITFINRPPTDKAKRDFDYKRLSETILAQVLLKLDAVETEGDPDARSRRKELVKEVQGMLNRLDEIAR